MCHGTTAMGKRKKKEIQRALRQIRLAPLKRKRNANRSDSLSRRATRYRRCQLAKNPDEALEEVCSK